MLNLSKTLLFKNNLHYLLTQIARFFFQEGGQNILNGPKFRCERKLCRPLGLLIGQLGKEKIVVRSSVKRNQRFGALV